MSTYLITTRTSVKDAVSEAIDDTAIHTFETAREALDIIVRNGCSVVLLDLASVPDAAHFISFIKSSSMVRRIPLIGIGAVDDFNQLEPGIRDGLAEMLSVPLSAQEITRIVARVKGATLRRQPL